MALQLCSAKCPTPAFLDRTIGQNGRIMSEVRPLFRTLLVHLVITLQCVSSSGPTVHCHYVIVVMCFMFTVCCSNTGAQEANNAIHCCIQYQASSIAVQCCVGDASHLEWMKPLGDCLIRLGPEVRTHLLHTHD